MPYPSRIDVAALGPAALAVVEAHGWESWSLRDVAAAVGVTPNALYRHVGDRAGLVVEIGGAAALALTEALRSVRGRRGSLRRIRSLAHRYLDFAIARPDAYVAFMEAKPPRDHPRIGPWLMLWDVVHQEIAAAVPSAADATGFALWAFLHGRIALARGPARAAGPKDGLDDAVDALLAGFVAAGAVRSPLPPGLARE